MTMGRLLRNSPVFPVSIKRQVGNDVRQRCEKDGGCQLGWTEPCCDVTSQARGKVALDAIAGNHGYVHQQTQRNDQRRHGHLLQVDSQHIRNAEGHAQRDWNCQVIVPGIGLSISSHLRISRRAKALINDGFHGSPLGTYVESILAKADVGKPSLAGFVLRTLLWTRTRRIVCARRLRRSAQYRDRCTGGAFRAERADHRVAFRPDSGSNFHRVGSNITLPGPCIY